MKASGVQALLTTTFVGALFLMLPTASASAAVQANVSGILPPGAACPAVGVSEITPFVYEGHLDSFEVNITDASYVAVAASVGGVPLDFHYMTRRISPDGTLRIHVDIASTLISGNLPISVTFLSARPDTKVTCSLIVRGEVSRGTIVPPAPIAPPAPSNPTGSTSHPANGHSSSSSMGKPIIVDGPALSTGGKGSLGGSVGTTSSTSTVKAPAAKPSTVFVGALHSLGSVCTKATAWKLWAILLVLYFLFVLALALQTGETLGDGSRGWNIALIFALLLALLGLWYLSAACRAGPWAPVIAILIALAGVRALMSKPTAEPPVLLIEKK